MTLPGNLLGAFPILATDDLDAARHAVARKFCDHKLSLTRGKRMRVRHNHVRGAHVSLNVLGYGADVTIDPGLLREFYLLQLPLEGAARICHRAEEVDASADVATILNPDRPTQMEWRGDCRKLLLQIDRAFMERVAEELAGSPLPGALRFDPRIDLTRPGGAELRRLLITVARLVDEDTLFTTRPGLREMQLEQDLARTLLELQPSNISHMLHGPRSGARPLHLKRAIEYIHQNYGEPIRLDDIAQAAEINPRSLQLGFKSAYGQSPIRYLHDTRLDAARYRLCVRTGRESVSNVAYACGFSHLGRFSRDYRARFGHAPSEVE